MNQGRVDLAEFDAPAADLHLIVGTALEVQAVGFQSHQITAAVGPSPAERLQWRVFLGIFVRVEVAGQADAADHQFADLPRLTGVPEVSTTTRSQPGSGRPMLTGVPPVSRAPHATTVASVGP